MELIKLIDVDFSNMEHASLIARWTNDISIKHFITISKNQDEVEKIYLAQDFYRATPKPRSWIKVSKFFQYKDELIGYGDIEIDPPYCKYEEKNTAWLSILIGERKFRGLGLGQKFFQKLEEYCIEKEVKQIELSVSELNSNALKMYKKLGYEQFLYVPDVSFYEGKFRGDYRLIKKI